MDLDLSISDGFVSSKIYDKCDGFDDFELAKFPLFGWSSVLDLTGFTFSTYSNC